MIKDEVILNGIIVDLRTAIDQLSDDSIRAKNLIGELARRLDEQGKCEKSEISTKIKELLVDKINDNKISSKWIEECLPRDYKRKYTRKSELSSLSKKTESIKVQDSNMIDNGDGSALLINSNTWYRDSYDDNGENIAADVSSSKEFELQECEASIDSTDPCQLLREENRELKAALKRQTKMVTGDQVPATEMEFNIPKTKYDEVKSAMASSMNFCCVLFEKSGILTRAVSDIFKTN